MRETSKAYIVSQIKLRNEVFCNWKMFYNHLKAGPEKMKQYFCDLWKNIAEDETFKGANLIDKDRIVTENDFDIRMNQINDITIFYLIFPDSDFIQAQAKCVALALSNTEFPRYFTMELGKHVLDGTPYYVLGEWTISNHEFVHKNYGEIPNGTIHNFANYVTEKIKKNIG